MTNKIELLTKFWKDYKEGNKIYIYEAFDDVINKINEIIAIINEITLNEKKCINIIPQEKPKPAFVLNYRGIISKNGKKLKNA